MAEPFKANLNPANPANSQGVCCLCQHEGLLVWDAWAYVCQDSTACNQRCEARQAEYERLLVEGHLKALAEYETEREKHRIPLEYQIWHVDYQEAGDSESGGYDYNEYAGTITLFGPFFGFDDTGTETIEVNSEDDAKYLVEKLNKLTELERSIK